MERARKSPGKNMSKTLKYPPKIEAITELLCDPATYDQKPSSVESIETHISWVFLTDRFAYKLKKPVRFDFLDFSTQQLRHEACSEEVRLNLRLAPNIYLGVIPITLLDGRLHLDGEGTPVDWVVKMYRLPVDRSLDNLIRCDAVTLGEVRQISHALSKFYSQSPPLTMGTQEYRTELEDHIRKNQHELLDTRHGLDPIPVRRVLQAQLRLLTLQPELLDSRLIEGRVVEGHGDLRPEHIYLVPSPTIIDCIEFNAEFRQLDVWDELAFLAMECDALGTHWVGEEVLKQYRKTSGDEPPKDLLPFYKSYRACVRAKVHALRAEQIGGQQRQESSDAAKNYLRLADGYCQQLGPPVLLIVRGLTGTGKSTLAAALAELLGIEHLQTDAIRRALYGKSSAPEEYGQGLYDPQSRSRIYDEMLHRSAALLDNGLSVILDGTFLTTSSRMDAVALAQSKHAMSLMIRCHCCDTVARQRITSRIELGKSLSESRPDIYSTQKQDEEPDPAGQEVCQVDTMSSSQATIKIVVEQLTRLYARSRLCDSQ